MKLFLYSAMIFCLTVITACAPRGETKSLDEILQTAQMRFIEAGSEGLDPVVAVELSKLKHLLFKSASDQNEDLLNDYSQVEAILNDFLVRVGFTTRPALAELIKQYQQQAKQEAVPIGSKKLLVARTFNLLAGELETTKFRIR